ncbi:hypothetical protein BKA70DRAFT_1451848 [Coprinopsis sp. MPI-PUGE-AT-0042]|nr:hypothetical protein BKA70DRAFT_1451848 [Coprinopsis sp. MPI-PUGE-AT-0042]
MDLHNGTLTVVVVSNYTLQATLAQAALQHPTAAAVLQTGSAALKEGNTAEAEPTAPLALSGIGVRIIVFKQGYMNIPIETLGFTLTGSIAIPVPTPAIYYADVAFRLLQERHLNPQLARLWPVSTASRRAFVGHRHIRCSCHIIPKYCADGRRGSQYLVNRYTSADSLMPSGDGYGKCAEPRVHDSELRLYSNLLTTPGDNPQHRPLLATVPKGSCAQTLPAKAHPSRRGRAQQPHTALAQRLAMPNQPENPHATRSATRSGPASLLSFSALAADLPPSFSIAALLRHAAELDHDAHLEDGSLSNERKREAGSEANVACPPSPGCDDRVPRPRSPEASTSNAPERRHRLSLRERARKSKKRRKASAPPASKSEPAAPSAPGEGSKKTKKNKARKNAKQKADREQEILQHGHQARPAAYKKYVSSAKPVPITVDLDLDSLPASSCGYQAKPKGSTKATVLSLSSLLEEGYTVEAWDGMANKILVDPITSKIFAACVGRPADESFDKAVDDAFEAMEHVRAVCGFDLDDWLHRRGHFPAFNVGVSYGQGQRAAQNLDIDEKYRKVLQELIKNPAIVRLAHYASGTLPIPY